MSTIFDKRNEAKENQSLMIMTMEKKLNPTGFGLFRFLNRKDPSTSTISVA